MARYQQKHGRIMLTHVLPDEITPQTVWYTFNYGRVFLSPKEQIQLCDSVLHFLNDLPAGSYGIYTIQNQTIFGNSLRPRAAFPLSISFRNPSEATLFAFTFETHYYKQAEPGTISALRQIFEKLILIKNKMK